MKIPKFKSLIFLYAIVWLKKTWTIFMCFFLSFLAPLGHYSFFVCWRDVWVLLNSYLLCSSEESFRKVVEQYVTICNYLTITLKVKFLSRYYYAPQKFNSLYFTTNSFFFNNRRGNAVLLPLTCKSLPLKTTVSYSNTASKRVSR